MGEKAISILLVEDNEDDALLLRRTLAEGPRDQFDLIHVERLDAAMNKLGEQAFDVVLLDLSLPDSRGLGTFRNLHDRTPAVPVVVLTGLDDETAAITAAKEGAQDYLVKGQFNRNLLVRAMRYAIERKRVELELANYAKQLRLKNDQMQADLDLAREVQMALLPQQFPTFPHGVALKDSALRFCGHYEPATTLGGDYYDVFALSDSAAGVLICDVMGHGVRAGLLTAMIRALMEELTAFTNGDAADPGRLLTQINRGLTVILKQARTTVFVTAFYLVADVARGRFRYANAGHPSPLLARRGRNCVELVGEANKPGAALGLFEDAVFETFEEPMAAGDMAMLFTDGLFEVQGPSGEIYGEKRLQEAVQKNLQLPAGDLFGALLAEVREFSQQRDLADDVCMVGMEVARVG
ncbi:MAG: SpoIIE family protein phosphatase [Verrucomicrobia bacterium]|nr:SpoIIE family protein phosphatase [Verrucomicrobiota bacterium]